MYVCMYVRMYVYMYVSMYSCIYVRCSHVCIYVPLFLLLLLLLIYLYLIWSISIEFCAIPGYLGSSPEEQEEWNSYDACVIVGTASPGKFDEILIDVGTADTFLKSGQLLPEVRALFVLLLILILFGCFLL